MKFSPVCFASLAVALMGGWLPLVGQAEVLFEENFDDQPDFTSTMHSTEQGQYRKDGFVLPEGWDALYQGTQWSPETGYPDNHASLEILQSNSDKARGNAGKSAVNWRESYSRGWNNWASDSQLIKLLDKQYKQVYIEFWISFSDNFYGRDHAAEWSSKFLRIGSWDGEGDIFNGALGSIGPVFFWDYTRNDYGIMNALSFRGGPWGENYFLNNSAPSYPRETVTNYGSYTLGQAIDGADPLVVNQVDGGYLKDIGRYTPITHNQLFGVGQHWTKVAFYVQVNSAPDATDGVLRQWINDQRIMNLTDIPWIKSNDENKMVGWNYIAIGGNDYFQPYPNDQRFEDWYAIDDVVVRSDRPENLGSAAEVGNPPNPPSDVNILVE